MEFIPPWVTKSERRLSAENNEVFSRSNFQQSRLAGDLQRSTTDGILFSASVFVVVATVM